jgi:voltage-gated potassium channel Kch
MKMKDETPAPDSKAPYSEDTTYDLFIMAVSFLALVLMLVFILPGVDNTSTEIAFALDAVISLIFLYDFLRSLTQAPNRRKYFFRGGGWLDLIGSFPIFPILRVLRIARMFRIYRNVRGLTLRDLWRDYRDNQAESAFWTTLLVTLLLLTIASLLIVPIEAASPNAEITDSGEALWWSIVTITTVGYGDLVPVTDSGRVLASTLMTVGVILVSVLTSFVTSRLMLRGDKNERERKARVDQGIRILNERFDRLEAMIQKLEQDRDIE